ncbi:hypothetical protein A6U85_31895 [Agrobacterium sp. 13-626]|nr:hypothetical protein A6U85_31895 [Agrobacterium sp. 13-626]
MQSWSPQHYRFHGTTENVPESILESAISRIELIRARNPNITPVLTLRHLSLLADVDYVFLRRVASRSTHPYRAFMLKKNVPGRTRLRLICVPNKNLKKIQDWIVRNILRHTRAHRKSFAYHPYSRPEFAAQAHCDCDYLLKVDIEDFFHRVSEGRVYKIFCDLGYSELVSLELARITTTVAEGTERPIESIHFRWPAIPAYVSPYEGFLPQGAPTSPMLSNLAMLGLDEQLDSMAREEGIVYTRYADDLTFSARRPHNAATIKRFKRRVLALLNDTGFRPNHRKTMIRGPGARRIVLGMLVDGPKPRLPNEFKDEIRKHLYYLQSEKFGPAHHSAANKVSISTLYHIVRGLIGWAARVEPEYGRRCLQQFKLIEWPPIDRGSS